MDKRQKVGRRRLATLIRFMEKLPASANKHWYMGHWFEHKGAAHHPQLAKRRALTRRDLTLCGTSACALGWASVCPGLQKAGLSMTTNGAVKLNGRGGDHFELAARFFGLEPGDASFLFSSGALKTPKRWARAAREVSERDA